jgi:hypothetical protein
MVIVVVILLAELVNAYFLLILQKYKSESHPYRSTIIHMAVMLVIYYPLITYLDKYLKSGSQQLVKQSQTITKNRNLGMLIGFTAVVVLIWMALAKIWYDADMVEDLERWINKTL